jgi:hypothetical protein
MNTPPPYYNPDQTPPDSKPEKTMTVWRLFATLYALAAVSLCIYWEIKNSGLCGMVRGWQEALLTDSYYPAFDILLSLLMLLLPMIVVKLLIEKITGVKL